MPSGLLTGTLTDLGDFDQCRSIRVNSGDEDAVTSLESSDDSNVEVSPVLGDEEDNEDGLLFRGSYCIAKFRPALPRPAPADISMDDVVINFNSSEQFKSLLGTVFDDAANLAQGFYSLPIHIALCVPSTCSVNDTTFLLSKLASPLHMTVSLDGNSCDSFNDSFALSFHQKISLITLTLLFLIVIICTLIDVTRHSNSFTLTKCSLNLTKTTSADFNEKDKCQPSKSTINCATDELVVGKNATINTVPSEGHSLSVNENIGCSTLNSVYRTPATVNESVCKNASTCPVTSEMGQPCAKLPDGRGEKPLDSIIIESFSLITNVGKLFTTKHNTSDTRIHFIHGTRVLTMVWIVICHTYTFGTQFLASVGSKGQILPLCFFVQRCSRSKVRQLLPLLLNILLSLLLIATVCFTKSDVLSFLSLQLESLPFVILESLSLQLLPSSGTLFHSKHCWRLICPSRFYLFHALSFTLQSFQLFLLTQGLCKPF